MALALSKIGPGDGATMVIPGGHKSNVDYRSVLDRPDGPGSMEGVLGAVELHLDPGDVLLFVDCLTVSSALHRARAYLARIRLLHCSWHLPSDLCRQT